MESRVSGSLAYKFMLVTQGAQTINCHGNGNGKPPQILQGPVLGLARVLCNEMPNVLVKMVDLPEHPDTSFRDAILGELFSDDQEEEVAIRNNARWCPRLEWDGRAEQSVRQVSPGSRYRLVSTLPGVLDRLALCPRTKDQAGSRGDRDRDPCCRTELPRYPQGA